MGLLDVKNLSFKYDNQIEKVFDNVSFQIDTNWKLGLIGRNGKGKTTLLELLMSKYEYRGYITPNYIFDYFPYHIENENIRTLKIVENILGEFELWEVQRELSLLDVENEVLEQNFATLSKGQQTKVLLAILFCKPHDFILIDEPTNHLDYHGRLLLSKYLKRKKSFILVSHDRDFLDRCIDHVLAINRNSIEVIKGNFSLWYDLKMNNDKREIEKNEQLKKDIGRLKKAARQNEDWSNKVEATKSVKVAGLKPDKGYVGHKAAKMMQRSKNIERRQSKAIEEKSDLLKNICIKSFAMGKLPEIPDVALDKHTVRGKAMGRDSFHFLNEASKVIPQMEVDNDYKERYAKILEEYDPENVSETAFTFNGWQF